MNINNMNNQTATTNTDNLLDELLESVQLTYQASDFPEGSLHVQFNKLDVRQNPSSGYIFLEFYGLLEDNRKVKLVAIYNEFTDLTVGGLLRASGCQNLKELSQLFSAGKTVPYTVTLEKSKDGKYMNWR